MPKKSISAPSPKPTPRLALRFNGLLETANSLAEDTVSVEPLVDAMLEDAVHDRSTDIHLEPVSDGY